MLFSLVLLVLFAHTSHSQEVKARSQTFSLEPPTKPAALTVAATFTEPSGDGVLDAGEKGTLNVTIVNSGGASAKGVVASLKDPAATSGITFSQQVRIGDIAPGNSAIGRFDISAFGYVQSQSVKLILEVSGDGGLKAGPKEISFSTRAATKPALLAITLQFSEPSGNNALDAGETGLLNVVVMNSGGSLARGVVARLKPGETVFGINFATSVQVGDIPTNGSASAQFTLQASENVRLQTLIFTVEARDASGVTTESKPITIAVRERVLARDLAGPEIEVWEPVSAAVRGLKVVPGDSKFATQSTSVVVRGIARDTSGVAVVYINNLESRITLGRNGYEFVGDALLVLGVNEIEVRALDRFKNESKLPFKVTRNPVTPVTGKTIPTNLFKGQRWAVVVGISKYKSSDIPPLRYADKDAQDFYELLSKPIDQGGAGVPKTNIRFLLNEQATAMNVREALADFLKSAIEEDHVFIYFAGHGAPDPDRPKVLYLLTYDSDLNRLASTSVKMQEIQDVLRDYVAAKTVLVFVDACHSRGVTGALATRALASPDLVNEYLAELSRARSSTMTFSASDINQLSQEDRRWGGGHGVFTHYLLEGLRGKADLNGDGMVRLGELTQYVSDNVRRETKSQQSPISSGNFDINLPLTVVVEK